MKKPTKLLLALALMIPFAGCAVNSKTPVKADSVSIVLPAVLAGKTTSEYFDGRIDELAGITWEMDKKGQIIYTMSPDVLSELRADIITLLSEDLEFSKKQAGEAVEKVDVSPDYSRIQVIANSEQLSQEDRLLFFTVPILAGIYQATSQIPADQVDVQLEFISRDDGTVMNSFGLKEVVAKLSEIDAAEKQLPDKDKDLMAERFEKDIRCEIFKPWIS
ncbi:MAG: hypothetical protein HUJ54_02470 [Erysipelotrichaceae bacterium]|nr:hypothetical protein [Erysipelotrichaceae bacterium]